MKDKTQLYIYPASYAREHGELEQYRADVSRTYTNKTESAGTVKYFQIRTKQIL